MVNSPEAKYDALEPNGSYLGWSEPQKEQHSYVLDVLVNDQIDEYLRHHLSSDRPLHLGICSKIVESSNLVPMQMDQ
jgi:hypothetical protein